MSGERLELRGMAAHEFMERHDARRSDAELWHEAQCAALRKVQRAAQEMANALPESGNAFSSGRAFAYGEVVGAIQMMLDAMGETVSAAKEEHNERC